MNFISKILSRLSFKGKNKVPRRKMKVVAIGLNKVNPRKWDGWNGYLSDCELDAKRATKLWKRYGIPVITLLTKKATVSNIKDALIKSLAGLSAGEWLVIWVSGHGGQELDISGDETDGMDEYICAYDGPILDDTINEWLQYVPKGVCILWVCDTCHSGTMNREAPVFKQRAIPEKFDGELILISGCAEKGTSQSTGKGGVLSVALLRTGPEGQTPLTWYKDMVRLVPKRTQRPQYVEYNVGEKFRNSIIV